MVRLIIYSCATIWIIGGVLKVTDFGVIFIKTKQLQWSKNPCSLGFCSEEVIVDEGGRIAHIVAEACSHWDKLQGPPLGLKTLSKDSL